jgi:hypothetical protein
MEPVSRCFGFDRGLPVDRYYIERFLAANSGSIRGRVLEIGDDTYTRRFGGERVKRSDILHVHAGNARATIVGDLSTIVTIPPEIFDCAIVTQTLQMIADPFAALQTLHRILRPSGTLLLTVPGITVLSPEADEWSAMWLWSFTRSSIGRMIEQIFVPDLVRIEVHGNVLSSVCMLQGIAVEDITTAELEPHDPEYPVIVAVRATKEPG